MRNIRALWWQEFVQKREDMVGIDSQILLHPQTWVASGHVSSFTDPMVEDKITHKRYRADHLIESWAVRHDPELKPEEIAQWSISQMADYVKKHHLVSPDGNEITEPKKFNLLFETRLGVVEGEKSVVYLRGETAQGIFTNFKNVVDSTRLKLPFGIGQIGKSFRNEITSGQFIFRTLEFELAEIEYFFDPQSQDWKEVLEEWKRAMWAFVTTTLGISPHRLRWRQHGDAERSHYSLDTFDLEYQFPFGWKELWGIAYRTDFDLKQHMITSGKNLEYTDPVTNRTFIPHVIEPAVGLNRLLLMILLETFQEEEKRSVLKLKPALAPRTVAVFPLVANKPALVEKARTIYTQLQLAGINIAWDDRGNIGKRYLSQDEAGTPWCVTVDYATLEDNTVTVRDRDTTSQVRVSISELALYFREKLQ
jgi:glycyl-tRNA synthetase